MPVSIDEVTADVDRGHPPETPAPRHDPEKDTSPQAERRKQSEMLAQIAFRAARLRAD